MKIIAIEKLDRFSPTMSYEHSALTGIFSDRKEIPLSDIELEWHLEYDENPLLFAKNANGYDYVAIVDRLFDKEGQKIGIYFTFAEITSKMCSFLMRNGNLHTYDALKIYANQA